MSRSTSSVTCREGAGTRSSARQLRVRSPILASPRRRRSCFRRRPARERLRGRIPAQARTSESFPLLRLQYRAPNGLYPGEPETDVRSGGLLALTTRSRHRSFTRLEASTASTRCGNDLQQPPPRTTIVRRPAREGCSGRDRPRRLRAEEQGRASGHQVHGTAPARALQRGVHARQPRVRRDRSPATTDRRRRSRASTRTFRTMDRISSCKRRMS